MEWNGQHGGNDGEKQLLGYSIDYYNEEQKLIIEWDDPYHFKGNQWEKDTERQNNIMKHLGNEWTFLRWNQGENDFRDIANRGSDKFPHLYNTLHFSR
jgi:very-short-patch-repair endonuclease